MHLGNRARGQRLRVDAAKHVFPGHPQLALHGRDHLGLRERGHPLLEGGQLFDERGGQQVGSGG